MPERAHVTSVEAIEAFRAHLLTYASKARPVLEEACDDVSRTRQWLEGDRRLHWEAQVRRRARDLEAAQQALFSAGLANLRQPTSAEHAAVQRARRALAEVEARLKATKRWALDFDNRVEPLVKQLDHLRTVLVHDLPKAAAYLAETIRLLDAYADSSVGATVATAPAAPAPGTAETSPPTEPLPDAPGTAEGGTP